MRCMVMAHESTATMTDIKGCHSTGARKVVETCIFTTDVSTVVAG